MRLRLLLVLIAVGTIGALSPRPTAAQVDGGRIQEGDVLTGRVTLAGEPVPEVNLTLHRITPEESGPWATSSTRSDGTFDFPLTPDTSASFTVFLVTADYLGVRYLGAPIHVDDSLPGDYTIVVHDTASVLPEPVHIPVRNVVLAELSDGSWEVNEFLRVRNPTNVALVPATPAQAAWEFTIPADATDFEVGEGDISAPEVTLMGQRVMLVTPLAPGQRELLIRYRLPPRPTRASFAIEEPTDTVNLFVQEPSHLTEVIGLSTANRIAIAEGNYLRYTGTDFVPGTSIDLAWSGTLSSPIDPVVAAVVVTLGLLFFGVVFAVRNRGAPRAA